MHQTLTIPGTLPGMNEIVATCKKHRQAYNELKEQCGMAVLWAITRCRLKPMVGPVAIHFTWVEPNAKRDPDNFRSGSKFILDALVSAEVLPGDGQQHILKLSDDWFIDKLNPRVDVLITQLYGGM